MIVVFSWTAVPLVFGSFVAAGVCWLLAAALGLPPVLAASSGLSVAGTILIVVDYFMWRRRDPDVTHPWRLVYSPAAAHVFFIPCWFWGAICVLTAGVGYQSLLQKGPSPWLGQLAFAAAIAVAAAAPLYEWLKPFDRFRWIRSPGE